MFYLLCNQLYNYIRRSILLRLHVLISHVITAESPVTYEANVRSETNSFEIHGGQCVTGTKFIPSTFCFSLSLSLHQCFSVINTFAAIDRRPLSI
jgi:hypothetical protein